MISGGSIIWSASSRVGVGGKAKSPLPGSASGWAAGELWTLAGWTAPAVPAPAAPAALIGCPKMPLGDSCTVSAPIEEGTGEHGWLVMAITKKGMHAARGQDGFPAKCPVQS